MIKASTESAQRFLKGQLNRVEGLEKIGLPEIGYQKVIVSNQAFNSMTFLYLMINNNSHIDELILSFYSFNLKALEVVDTLMREKFIKKFFFQTSNLRKYGSDRKLPNFVSEMKIKYGKERVSGNFINSHAKVMLCKIGKNYYSIEGSGNMSLVTVPEQYVIDNSEGVYNFHKDWIKNYPKAEPIR